ncbi:hypothetical protein ACFR9U_00780 [Halorientalis brevis]|uniref:Uncharacterized protein n=1 Tax=Halorientalis brevis TaxID=1126241 RepID=A0ABD6C656_9EURY|nr:hypothetical protein [Halorientalis brevis]
MNEGRERRLEHLVDATGERTKSKAIDTAAEYYIQMAGCDAVPTGAVEQLMQLAVDEGSVTPAQIATILDLDELPVCYDHEWSVGHK